MQKVSGGLRVKAWILSASLLASCGGGLGEVGEEDPSRARAEEASSREAEAARRDEEERRAQEGVEWVRIEGGSFRMGSTSGDDDERPVHTVRVSSFYITKTEVTVSQWEACKRAGRCASSHVKDKSTHGSCNLGHGDRGDHPMNCIDWEGAKEVCGWMGGRLPSEAEWEYAARSGGRDRVYPWGDQTASCTYAVMDDGGNGCGSGHTMEVCSKTAGNTDQGLCDMAGNVWEWVEDTWHDDYFGAPTDGDPWTSYGDSRRAVRGGSWYYDYPYFLRASFRSGGDPASRDLNFGVRCSRDG